MNIRQLEYFIAIVETRSITQAAKRLFVSQPPMSRQVALLEEEMGVRLLVRTNRGVELTDAGKVLYKRSKGLLNDLKEMVEEAQETESGVRGHIKVGAVYSAIPCFANYVRGFRQQYPNVDFYLEPSLPHELLISLQKGDIDVAFLRSPMSETGNYPSILLEEERLVLAIHETMDPCPERDTIPVEQLKELPFCAQARAPNWDYRNWDYNASLQEECRRRGFSLNAIYECKGALASLMLTCAGLAACYVPEKVCQLIQCPEVHLKGVEGLTIQTAPILLWNGENYVSRCLRLFLEYFKTIARMRERAGGEACLWEEKPTGKKEEENWKK